MLVPQAKKKKKMESSLFEGQAVENQVFSKKKKRKQERILQL